MNVKELSRKEFELTFSERMNDITNKSEAIIDIWEYVKLLDQSKYSIDNSVINKKTVEKAYRNSIKTFDHILIPTSQKNMFLIIIVSIKNKNIFGHYLLDLNKEYSI